MLNDSGEKMAGSYSEDPAQGSQAPGMASNHGNGDATVVHEGAGRVREAGHLGIQTDHVEGTDGEGAFVSYGHRAGLSTTTTGQLGNADEKLVEREEDRERGGAKSVINVEIRSKSLASCGSRVSGEKLGRGGSGGYEGKPKTVIVDHASGVAPDIAVSGMEISGEKASKAVIIPNPKGTPSSKEKPTRRKKMKKSIFISYSPDAGFTERKFVVECVKQFKENSLADDIWFDKDEKAIETMCWFSQRIEAVERCRAAVVFLSERYFASSCSYYEAKTLLERQNQDNNSVRIFTVLFSESEQLHVPQTFIKLAKKCLDLTSKSHIQKSLAEKSSMVVGGFMMELEKIASVNALPVSLTPPGAEFTGEYKKKKLCHWSANDLQEWLFKLGVKEFYRQSVAEYMVDGFLLMRMTEQDMIAHLAIDNRVLRRKLSQQIIATLEKEQKLADNWHVRAKALRPRPNAIYLVYDPADMRIGQNLKHDLAKKGLQVYHHGKLGTSKEEFLQYNGPLMAQATHILVIMTDAASSSPFVFHELLFAEWLKRRVVIAQFNNTWHALRPALRAVIGDRPAVDFETKLYTESMAILEHHLKPFRSIPGVVLEQGYLNKMSEGVKPLFALANHTRSIVGSVSDTSSDGGINPRVFISYQWDMASKVEEIRRTLEPNGLICWSDIGSSMSSPQHHPPGLNHLNNNNGINFRNMVNTSQSFQLGDLSPESLTTQIQRHMKAAGVVVCCVTPKYMQSDNCIKDLSLAENLNKPIIPVMLRFCPWPPEAAPLTVRKILVKHVPVDLSNEKLYKQNVLLLLDRIKRCLGMKQ